MHLDYLNVLFLHLHVSKSDIHILVLSNLLHTNKFFQYHFVHLFVVYFNSVTKPVINYKFRLKNSFQEILYMIDVWINNGSGWIIELIESQYINL